MKKLLVIILTFSFAQLSYAFFECEASHEHGPKYHLRNLLLQENLTAYFADTGIRVVDSSEATVLLLQNDLLFTDSAIGKSINPAYHVYLNKIVELLEDYPQAKLEVVGHTDATLSDVAKLQHSEQYAKTVADYLVNSGIKMQRIVKVAGRADYEPVAENNTFQGRHLNRRVELHLQ